MKFRLVYPWAGGSMERILQPVMRWLQVSAEVLRPLRQEHKQLLLFHNAVSAYFSGNQSALESTMKQFSIKVKSWIFKA